MVLKSEIVQLSLLQIPWFTDDSVAWKQLSVKGSSIHCHDSIESHGLVDIAIQYPLTLNTLLPLSDGEGSSLSSRSSADDMVPVEGVLGSWRLKTPVKKHINHHPSSSQFRGTQGA